MIKKIWPIFPRSFECAKPQETFYKGPEPLLTNAVELIGAFFLGPKRLLKTLNFEIK